MKIKLENPTDTVAIRKVITTAFKDHPFSAHNEHLIVERLRENDALALSLVALDEKDIIVGHIAFSPISINNQDHIGWYGLGPVSVMPEQQNKGIGSALIKEGITRLKRLKAQGIVLLGEPEFYKRFGFTNIPELYLPDVPAEYFMALPFNTPTIKGSVKYNCAFEVEK